MRVGNIPSSWTKTLARAGGEPSDKAGVAEALAQAAGVGDDDVVEPVEQPRARLLPHPPLEVRRERRAGTASSRMSWTTRSARGCTVHWNSSAGTAVASGVTREGMGIDLRFCR
jgi:hypothetical protein